MKCISKYCFFKSYICVYMYAHTCMHTHIFACPHTQIRSFVSRIIAICSNDQNAFFSPLFELDLFETFLFHFKDLWWFPIGKREEWEKNPNLDFTFWEMFSKASSSTLCIVLFYSSPSYLGTKELSQSSSCLWVHRLF